MGKNQVPDRIVFPHLWAWYVFLSQYPPAARNGWKAAAPPKKAEEAKKAEPAAEEEDEDDFDFFSGGAEAEEAAAKIKEEKKKEAEKNKVICKSYVVFEVKPTDDSVDLDELAEKVFASVQMEGLLWKQEFKKEPAAYGIFKLIVGCTIVDDLVSTDDMIEQIEGIQGMINPESDEEEEEEEDETAEKPPKEKVEGCVVQSVEILA